MTASMADDVERELAALAELDRTALLQRWRMAFGRDAPPCLSRTLMEKAIAYDVQVKALGGLSARGRGAGGWLPLARGTASLALRDRPGDHRHQVVRPTLLRPPC